VWGGVQVDCGQEKIGSWIRPEEVVKSGQLGKRTLLWVEKRGKNGILVGRKTAEAAKKGGRPP